MPVILPDRPLVPDYLLRVRLSMLLCMVMFALVLGLNHQLLTLLLQSRGYEETAIGISAAMMPIGILVSSFFVSMFSRILTAAMVAVYGLLLSALMMFLLYMFEDYYAWLLFRFFLGAGINVTFIIGEACVNESAKASQRSKILAIYMTLLSGGFAGGPLIVSFSGVFGFLPFGLGIGMALLAAVPIYYYRRNYPDFEESKHPVSFWQFLLLAPVLLFSVFIVTMMDQSLLAFLSLYGLAHGLVQSDAVLLVSYLVLGTVLLQYPIGLLASFFSNTRLISLCCSVLSLCCFLLIPLSMGSHYLYIPLIVFSGGISFSIYTLSMVELGHRFSGATLLAGTACFSFLWGIGGLVASPITGALMENFGSNSLMYFTSLLFFILSSLLLFRLNRGKKVYN